MRIGIPREVKDGEFRVALSPRAIHGLAAVVERGAGAGVGFSDDQYLKAGATLGDPWQCELVVKVKELQDAELDRVPRDRCLFGFHHLPGEPARTAALRRAVANLVYDRTIAGAGHNDIYDRPEFRATMGEALERVLAESQRR